MQYACYNNEGSVLCLGFPLFVLQYYFLIMVTFIDSFMINCMD